MLDHSLPMQLKPDPSVDDAATPFFFGNLLNATTSIEADTIDPLSVCTMPTPIMTAASSFSSNSTSFPDVFGSWSSVATDSRPPTMASSFNDAFQATLPSSQAASLADANQWTSKGSLSGYHDPIFSPLESQISRDPCSLSAQFSPGKSMPVRRFTTGAEPRPAPFAFRNASFSDLGRIGLDSSNGLGAISGSLQATQPSIDQASQQIVSDTDSVSVSVSSTTDAKVSAEDGLALWLGQDILAELLDEMKGQDPTTPIAELHQSAENTFHPLSTWDAKFCRRRRNAVAQLPPLVSCGLMASMVSVASQRSSDHNSLSSSEEDDDLLGGSDQELAGFDRVCSPRSCPLSPTARPMSPKSGSDPIKAASFDDTTDLPQMHRILSSWNFTCDRQRRRKAVKPRKRTRSSQNRPTKHKQLKPDANKASKSGVGRGPGRPRKATTGSSAAGSIHKADMDSDFDFDPMLCCDSPSESVFEDDSATEQETHTNASRKRQRGLSKTSGNTFSITSQVVLRPRTDVDEEEVPYPNYPATHDEAKGNNGPTASQGGEDAIDETQVVFPADLYAPRFTRRGPHGREGWCSLCTNGEWYSMKRSQYLYHLQYDHGICSLTRKAFDPPVHMRVWNDATERTEGLCEHCQEWIPISFGSVRKRDYKAWFKHAQKCHRHKA